MARSGGSQEAGSTTPKSGRRHSPTYTSKAWRTWLILRCLLIMFSSLPSNETTRSRRFLMPLGGVSCGGLQSADHHVKVKYATYPALGDTVRKGATALA